MIIVDLFAGGGGASTGLEAALGRPVDDAINHDPIALAVHKANHPGTRHWESDVWEVKPEDVAKGREVSILWASPDCTHFSVAKGDVPRSQKIRSLAEVVIRWARKVRPPVIFLENVAEFKGWGPLGKNGKPIKAKSGETFNRWKRKLERLGYKVEHRILDSSLYGAPTRRRRLFLIARCDGLSIVWPKATHGPGLLPVRTAAECIDWSLPCPSIFDRKKPLADKTMWRIAQGIRRFVLENPQPFIVKVNHGNDERTGRREYSIDQPLTTITAKGRGHAVVTPFLAATGGPEHGGAPQPGNQPMPTVMPTSHRVVVAPTLIQTGYGEDTKRNGGRGQAARVPGLDKPLGTLMAGGQKHALVAAFLAKHFGDRAGGWVGGQELCKPSGTITAKDHHSLAAATLVKLRGDCNGSQLELPMPVLTAGGTHVAEVRAFLATYYSSGSVGQKMDAPLRTVTGKDRLGLITIEGTDYQIVDIGMRMLQPHELLRAQFGRFSFDYDLSAARTKAAQVRLIGNSVPPEVVEAVVRENVAILAPEVAA